MSAHPSAFWHPFADMSAVAGHDLVISSGQGSRVTSEDGREFLDASAGLWFCNVGHGRREIADAVMQQMTSIAAYSNFGDLATRSTLDLADRLAALAPMPDAKVFFTSGGSDAVDTAVKIVRRYWNLLGQPQRTTVITRTKAYHGMHLAGHLAGRDRREPRRLRPAGRRRRQCRVGRRGCARREDRRAGQRERRGLLLRAGHRRGRRVPAAAGVPRRRPRDLPRSRRAVRCRRGHHRVRTDGPDVRVRGARAGPRADRQGPDLGLPADGRGARRRFRGRALLAHAGLPVAARLHVLGPCSSSRRRDGQPRHHRGRAARGARRRSSARAHRRAGAAAGSRVRGRRPLRSGPPRCRDPRPVDAGGGPDAHAARARWHARAGRPHPRPRGRLGPDLACVRHHARTSSARSPQRSTAR